MKKLISIVLSIAMLITMVSVMAISANAEDDVWLFVGDGVSTPTKSYTKTEYPDASDALQAAFDDVKNGVVTLSASSFIIINQDMTLTKQVVYTYDKTLRLKNVHTITYSPTDTANATTAIKIVSTGENITVVFLYGNGTTSSGSYTANAQFVPYGNNAFFESGRYQLGGAFKGDISIKDFMYLKKLGNYTYAKISGNLIVSGVGSDSSTNYDGTSITIDGNFDYSAIADEYKSNVANFATKATIKGEVISEAVVDPYEDIAGETLAAAQLRIGSVNGIRFITEVDTDLIAAAEAEGYTVAMGTLIAPLSYGTLTTATDPVINIAAPGYYKEQAGKIAASIVNIKPQNISKDFVARGYVTLTKDETTTVYYATQPNEGRSLKTLSAAALADEDLLPQLTPAQIAQITEWAND